MANHVIYPQLSLHEKLVASSFYQILGASLFIAFMTQIRIFFPFTPVPFTGQTFAVALVGALLGSRKGAISVLLYLFEGIMGLPFFSLGGSGLFFLMGPTGGYLLGFIAQAYLVGWFMERQRSFCSIRVCAVLLSAQAVVLLSGLCWLSRFVRLDQLLAMGCYPFLFGEIFKAVSLTYFLQSLKK